MQNGPKLADVHTLLMYGSTCSDCDCLKQLTNADVVMLLQKGKLTGVGRLRPPFSAEKTVLVVTPAVPPSDK